MEHFDMNRQVMRRYSRLLIVLLWLRPRELFNLYLLNLANDKAWYSALIKPLLGEPGGFDDLALAEASSLALLLSFFVGR
jgi:hypothetical protein